MKNTLFKTIGLIAIFSVLLFTQAHAQYGNKYRPNTPSVTLTNTDTADFEIHSSGLRRNFTQSYDVAGVLKRTELTGTNLFYTLVIQESYKTSGDDWITTKTITADSVGTSQLVRITSHTNSGDRARVRVIQSGTGTASFEPQLILWLRTNGLY